MQLNDLKDRLRFARKQAGFTQSQLGELVGLNQSAINKLESGKSRNSGQMTSLAMVLGVNPLWLVHGIGEICYQNNLENIVTPEESIQQTFDTTLENNKLNEIMKLFHKRITALETRLSQLEAREALLEENRLFSRDIQLSK